MTEPATSAAAATATGIFTFANIKWVLGGGLLIYIIKLIVDYAYVKRDVQRLGEDVTEIKAGQKEINAKMDKVLECSRENGKQIGILHERTKEK